MNCHSFWRYVFLGLHSLTLLGVMILVTAKMPNTSGAKINQTELQNQIINKTLYFDNFNWTLSDKPEVTIIDSQVTDGINVVFYEVKDNKAVMFSDTKLNLKENKKTTLKMKAFCKSIVESVRGRMIVTKISVIDSIVSE